MGNETTDVTKPIMRWLESEGVMVCRNNTGRRGWVSFGLRKGSADIIAIVPPHGRLLSVETKVKPPALTKTGRVSKAKGKGPNPDQIAWAEDVTRNGGVAVFATCIDDVREALEVARTTGMLGTTVRMEVL